MSGPGLPGWAATAVEGLRQRDNRNGGRHWRSLFMDGEPFFIGRIGLIGSIGPISPIRPMSPISLIRSHSRESLARGFDRSFDDFVGVRGRDEGGFELRRGEVYA